jgi:hypothetical protein
MQQQLSASPMMDIALITNTFLTIAPVFGDITTNLTAWAIHSFAYSIFYYQSSLKILTNHSPLKSLIPNNSYKTWAQSHLAPSWPPLLYLHCHTPT